MRPITKARMMVLGLVVALACSELLAQGQSSLERARRLVSVGSFDKAEAMLRQTIAVDPSNIDARVLLGKTLALQGARSEAIKQLAEAVRLNPSSATAHNEFGMVLSRFVEVRTARREFERALELDPGLAEAHVNLSLVLAQAGELSAAGDHLDRAIELQGNRRQAAYAHYLRAKIWAAQDQIDKAMDELERAVHLRPDYATAWSDLGRLRRLALDNAGAIVALQRAVVLKPDDALAQYRLGQLYLHDGHAIKAVEHLKQALFYNPNDRATLYNLMLALRKAGRTEDTKPIEKRLAELQQQSDRASEVGFTASDLNSEGIQLERSGDIRAALAKYRAALDLDPTGFGFRLNYALALCRLGRWQDGIVELREVLRLDPDNADAAKALYIAVDKAKPQYGDVGKRP